ncbi:MAG: M24 family metallopeptidase [bacterium]
MKKIKTLQRILKPKEMLYIDSSSDVFNLIDLNKSFNPNEYDAGLLIGKKHVYLICEVLFYPHVRHLKGLKVLKADSDAYLASSKTFIEDIERILKREKAVRLGLTNPSLSRHFKRYITFHFMSPSKVLGIVKSGREIDALRACSGIMKDILERVPGLLKTSVTDLELRNEIDNMIYGSGAQRRYVPTLVGFNAKTVYPTIINKKLKRGNLVLVDFGIMKNGTGLSIARTLPYGSLSSNKKKHLSIVNDGLEVMKSVIQKGIEIRAIDSEYRQFMGSHKLDNSFIDYSVKLPGTSYYEETNSIKDRTELRDNSVIKISSSLFVPGRYGIKNEELILVKGNSNETLL